MSIVLADHGQTFATRTRARDVLAAELGKAPPRSVTIDADGVYMSPSFIGEVLVVLLDEREDASLVVRGASEHGAHITQDLARKFGFGDRVRVEQPAPSA